MGEECIYNRILSVLHTLLPGALSVATLHHFIFILRVQNERLPPNQISRDNETVPAVPTDIISKFNIKVILNRKSLHTWRPTSRTESSPN